MAGFPQVVCNRKMQSTGNIEYGSDDKPGENANTRAENNALARN
jgi:hypothetical protein